MLWRDFISLTGIDISNKKPSNWHSLIPSQDCDGWSWECDNEEFKKEYGFDYGNDSCMMYFYPSGARKALNLLMNDSKNHMTPGAYKLLTDGLNSIRKIYEIASPAPTATDTRTIMIDTNNKNLPININISFK